MTYKIAEHADIQNWSYNAYVAISKAHNGILSAKANCSCLDMIEQCMISHALNRMVVSMVLQLHIMMTDGTGMVYKKSGLYQTRVR
jgi:hypothetical protein